jgi:hypothetical protein
VKELGKLNGFREECKKYSCPYQQKNKRKTPDQTGKLA